MRAGRILLLSALILGRVASLYAQTATPWQTGTYDYDGAGNIKSIGAEQYRYDALGRMKTGTVATGQTQGATYDRYGNITSLTTNGTLLTFGVDASTNRLTETQSNVYGTYDSAGRLTAALSGTGGSFVYDDVDMVRKTTVDGVTKVHVYTASDERILSITLSNNAQEWTLRDPSNRVLRRLQRNGTQWTWKEDDIYGAGQLIAAEVDTPAQTLHFFSDHLGTPRLITANGGTKVAFHTYYPFGAEATSPNQDSEKLKFTGHERDAASLDYMHARYYAPLWGRFLSVDATNGVAEDPQSWNRYAYCKNQPISNVDPDGNATATAVKVASESRQLSGLLRSPAAKLLCPMCAGSAQTFSFVSRLMFFGDSTANVVVNGGDSTDTISAVSHDISLASEAFTMIAGPFAANLRAGVQITAEGLSTVEAHLAKLESPENTAMLQRLRAALASGRRLTGADANFYQHELAEAALVSEGYSPEAAHEIVLQEQGVSPFSLYHPDVVRDHPSSFNELWLEFWGIK